MHEDDTGDGREVAASATRFVGCPALFMERRSPDTNGGLQMEAIGAPMDAEQRVAAAGYLEDLLVDLITLSLNTEKPAVTIPTV
jgi:hypothetical protein